MVANRTYYTGVKYKELFTAHYSGSLRTSVRYAPVVSFR